MAVSFFLDVYLVVLAIFVSLSKQKVLDVLMFMFFLFLFPV